MMLLDKWLPVLLDVAQEQLRCRIQRTNPIHNFVALHSEPHTSDSLALILVRLRSCLLLAWLNLP